ncbi:hypothetical protein Vafri_6909 [Volvox africanus]|uniref:J domain-containing protein n=1 Tax=Volvox africanus TaxID=51714 RepID=A0A8J4B3D2_9CHLO|nr:hypothetical protein Vafri_6909 [Volvox africanus]
MRSPHRREWAAPASHYEVLGLVFGASHEEIKRAYREAARRWHPDKGGSAAAFARVQAAWEVLGDAHRRAAYDTCAYDYFQHYVHQDRQRSSGGEAALLAELQERCAAAAGGCKEGAVVPSCQLVVTCELCGRPATRDCSVCGMPFCSFCARRQHWRGSHPLHWPLVVAHGSMLERLGRREMEAKRLEDDRRLAASNPHHRSEAQLRELRAFNEAAALAAARSDHTTRYDPALGRLYMWTQTESHVLLACYLPNGRHDREVQVEVRGGVLRLGVADGLPVVHRALAGPLNPAAPMEVYRTSDGLFALVVLTKVVQQASVVGNPLLPDEPRVSPTAWPWRSGGCGRDGGAWWRQIFRGDSDGARSLPPPYSVTQLPDEVVLDFALPWWIRKEDVTVELGIHKLVVMVRGVGLHIERYYWCNSSEAAARQPVVPEFSSWSLGDDGEGRVSKPVAIPSANVNVAKSSVSVRLATSNHDNYDNHDHHNSRSMVAGAVHRTMVVAAKDCSPPCRRHGGRCLSIVLARPELTWEERMYKKGVRQDNRQATRLEFYRPHMQRGRGVRFLQEDEDTFGLEALLQAAMFRLRGGAWVVRPPWCHDEPLDCRWVDKEVELPALARAHLTTLRASGTPAGRP